MPDGLPVPVLSLSLSLNVTSWTWGFDAQLPASAEGLVAPSSAAGPVELVARINGTDFRVLGERILRERVFGEASIRVSGRGHNAVLAGNRSLSGVLFQPAPARNNPSHIHQGGAGSDQGDSDQQQVAAA